MYAIIDQNTDKSPKVTHRADASGDSGRSGQRDSAKASRLECSRTTVALELTDAIATTLGSIPEPDARAGEH